MSQSSGTIRVVIPLAIRKRNGRPKILPPADMETAEPTNQGPHVLRAVARAWGWRRKLETGAMTTLQDIAAAEKISDRFVGRMMRLAYRDGILPCLTNPRKTDINNDIQWRYTHPRHTGRDRSE